MARVDRAAALLPGLLLCLSLQACGPGTPPAGYRPQAVGKPGQCPDLSGAWRPQDTTWLNEFVPHKVAGLIGDPVVVAGPLASGSPGMLMFRSDREVFLAHARQTAAVTPSAYVAWRRAVLALSPEAAESGAGSGFVPGRTPDRATLQAAAERLGPLYEVRVPISVRQCTDDWALLGYRNPSVHEEAGGRPNEKPKEIELWISRSAAGELLFRRVTYDLTYYSIWAPSMQSLRTGARSEYSKWAPVTAGEGKPLLASDLPDPPAQVGPSREACRFTPAQTQRVLALIKAQLPPEVNVISATPGMTHGLPQPDGGCAPTPFSLELTMPDTVLPAQVRSILQGVSGITYVEPLRRSQQHPGRQVARMMARAVPE